ncbi:MAG: hypothetical protein II945_06185 [Bacteroidales bacterium]|nr:hypothetical protein [Bacteroidales bacterium]
MKMSRNNNKTMTHGAWNFGKFVEGSIMKKILIVTIGLLCGSCIFSPYELPEKKSSKQFIEHLTEVDNILNDTILCGWKAYCRPEPGYYIGAYHLRYDTARYRPYYINYYKLDSANPVHKEHAVDTALLCRCWGIDKDSFQTHVNKVCSHIRKITNGYYLHEMRFSRNGFYFFASEYNGWGVIYQRDSVLNNEEQQEYKLSLPKNGYSQVGNTKFWVNDNDE